MGVCFHIICWLCVDLYRLFVPLPGFPNLTSLWFGGCRNCKVGGQQQTQTLAVEPDQGRNTSACLSRVCLQTLTLTATTICVSFTETHLKFNTGVSSWPLLWVKPEMLCLSMLRRMQSLSAKVLSDVLGGHTHTHAHTELFFYSLVLCNPVLWAFATWVVWL